MEREDGFGVSPLVTVSRIGNLPVVSYLVDKAGADVLKADENGRASLFWAAWKGSLPVVQFLVQAGADVERVAEFGETALSEARRLGRDDVVTYKLCIRSEDDTLYSVPWHMPCHTVATSP